MTKPRLDPTTDCDHAPSAVCHYPSLRGRAAHIEEKILCLRRTYHLGQQPIAWYLLRYHDIKISPGAVCNVLVCNGLNRLPQNAKRSKRVQLWQRYEKQVPGHHIQVDGSSSTSSTGQASLCAVTSTRP